jgi:hypothetical protein
MLLRSRGELSQVSHTSYRKGLLSLFSPLSTTTTTEHLVLKSIPSDLPSLASEMFPVVSCIKFTCDAAGYQNDRVHESDKSVVWFLINLLSPKQKQRGVWVDTLKTAVHRRKHTRASKWTSCTKARLCTLQVPSRLSMLQVIFRGKRTISSHT